MFDYIQSHPIEDVAAHYDGEIVSFRGFIYPVGDNRWIIADNPGLASCCTGRSDLRNSQIYINAVDPLPDKWPLLVQATGRFSVLDNGTSLYTLTVTKIEPIESTLPYPLMALSLTALGLLALGYGTYRWKKLTTVMVS